MRLSRVFLNFFHSFLTEVYSVKVLSVSFECLHILSQKRALVNTFFNIFSGFFKLVFHLQYIGILWKLNHNCISNIYNKSAKDSHISKFRSCISVRRFKRGFIIFITLITIVGLYYNSIDNVSNSNLENSIHVLSKLGSRGTEVRQIQTKLRQLGFYKGSVDGIYGKNTRNAVIAFQKSCGITADGIAGPKTLLYLGLGSSSSNGFNSNDKYLLAKVIAAEARGESYTGQVAVGAVILNRVDHSSFPDSISGVVYQSGAFDCVYDKNWSVEPDAS